MKHIVVHGTKVLGETQEMDWLYVGDFILFNGLYYQVLVTAKLGGNSDYRVVRVSAPLENSES